MATWQFYVGANNTTGQVDRELLITTLSEYVQGYTLIDGNGYWQGKPEPMALVIADGLNEVGARRLAQYLRGALEQDAVAYHGLPTMQFVD